MTVNSRSASRTAISSILLKEGRMEIGQYDPGSCGSFPLPLKTGWTIASLKMSGNIPELRLKLQTRAIRPTRTATPFFQTCVGISSTPIALVSFKLLIFRVTLPAVTKVNEKVFILGWALCLNSGTSVPAGKDATRRAILFTKNFFGVLPYHLDPC